jgi:hypothetical protein
VGAAGGVPAPTLTATSLLAPLMPPAFCATTRTKNVPAGTPGTASVVEGAAMGTVAIGVVNPADRPAIRT